MNNRLRRTTFVLTLFILVTAACSSAESSTPVSAPPTVTSIPVFQYVAPTEAPQMATAAARTATSGAPAVSADPTQLARGGDRYTALECHTCHGENGEGSEEGPALTSFAMTEADFISFMRSGGALGTAHQYSTNRLSASGGTNLYQYLLSLSNS